MSVEQAHQRLGIAVGVIHELQGTSTTSICRTSSGSRSTPSDPSRNEYSSQSDRYEVTHSIGGAEEFDARSIWEEEWSELENLVEFGKGLRWRSACNAETSDEECGEQEAADCRDKSPTYQELQHFFIPNA